MNLKTYLFLGGITSVASGVATFFWTEPEILPPVIHLYTQTTSTSKSTSTEVKARKEAPLPSKTEKDENQNGSERLLSVRCDIGFEHDIESIREKVLVDIAWGRVMNTPYHYEFWQYAGKEGLRLQQELLDKNKEYFGLWIKAAKIRANYSIETDLEKKRLIVEEMRAVYEPMARIVEAVIEQARAVDPTIGIPRPRSPIASNPSPLPEVTSKATSGLGSPTQNNSNKPTSQPPDETPPKLFE